MDLLLSLLKNEYENYKAELLGFADYGAAIADNYNFYLENRKNLTKTQREEIQSIINKISTLVSNIKSKTGK